MRIPLHKVLLFIHDVIIITLAIILANIFYSSYSGSFELGYISKELALGYGLVFITMFLTLAENDLYKYQIFLNTVRQVIALQKAAFLSLVGLIFLSFLFKAEEVQTSRVLFGLIYANIAVLFLITRVLIIPNVFFSLVRSKVINRNLLIVGLGKISLDHAEEIIENRNSYFKIVGFVDDEESELGQAVDNIPVLGKISQLGQIVEFYNISDILVASDCKCDDRLHEIIDACKETNRTVHIVSEFYNIATEKIQIEELGKVSAFRYVPPQRNQRFIYPHAKRLIDIAVALAIIIALSPLWILLSIMIKLSSPGPVFYLAEAIGKDGKPFFMYKFRSMHTNANSNLHKSMVRKMIVENSATKKLVRDPRITPIGRVLRKLSIDEFPQLINVLTGEMSLVGPRPCLPYEYEVMKEWQKQRCAIQPGMTGIWQIKGRDEVLFSEQIILDLYYKEHRSMLMDFEILINTIPVVIFGRGGA